MVLTELAGGVALRLEGSGHCDPFVRHTHVRARLADRGQPCPQRDLACDEACPAGRATRLRIVVGESHALRRQFVEVGRLAGHHALVICTNVEPADIVSHDDEDVWFLLGRLSDRFGVSLLRVCCREQLCSAGSERTTWWWWCSGPRGRTRTARCRDHAEHSAQRETQQALNHRLLRHAASPFGLVSFLGEGQSWVRTNRAYSGTRRRAWQGIG